MRVDTGRAARSALGAVVLGTALALLLQVLPAYGDDGGFARDDTATTVRGRAVDLDVTANDDGDGLRVVAVSEPEHGSAQVLDERTIRYQPDPDFTGTDSFRYEVRRGEDRDRATVTITVTEPLTVRTGKRWRVLVPATIRGQGPPGAALTVRVAGPRKTKKLHTTIGDDGKWTVPFTPAWPGAHRVEVRAAEHPDTATLTVPAVAKYLSSVSGALARRDVPYSYRRGCPVAPASLRKLSVAYWGWNGRPRLGTLVVNRRAVKDLRHVFRVAFRTEFPIRRMTPVDAYYAGGRRTPMRSDVASMRADNTSAFNCRPVTGVSYRRSPHSYGTSIDLNPRENPYVTARRVYPKGVRRYLNRAKVRKGMLVRSSPVVKAFLARGWRWGVRFRHADYQHFDQR